MSKQPTSSPASHRWPHFLVLSIIAVFLALPVLATALYAIALDWGATILPKGWTLTWLSDLWSDKRFLLAFRNSLFVCVASALVCIVVCMPILMLVHTKLPKLGKWMNVVVTLPFAVPPVVASVGLLQLYSNGFFAMTGTPWILIGCYFTIALPFVYRALDNNMRALNIKELVDAAELLGASTWQATWYVVLPNLKNGMLVAFFVSLSFLMGEFVFANLLASSRFETIQVYLYSIKNMSGHYSSALVFSYFSIILLLTFVVSLLNENKRKRNK